ncbi:TMV resistance protein N-like [Quillaja saponaria]|uniref:TMV resistance protein N-like n=1 Tax=Quillaja saponaria TaxID=32244 RepID=A0AAD7QJV0_QUISA|nr:TMV resistance protein N-like [Quillaja saponaria]
MTQGNQWAYMLLSEGLHEEPGFNIMLSGSEIPEWIGYRSLEGSVSFQLCSEIAMRIEAVALCTAFGSKEEEENKFAYEVQIFINGKITNSLKDDSSM